MQFYLVQAHPDREPEPYSDAEGFAHFGAAWPEVRGEELAPDGSGRTLAELDESIVTLCRACDGTGRYRLRGAPYTLLSSCADCEGSGRIDSQAGASGGR